MFNGFVHIILSYTIVVAAIIGAVRYKKIIPQYRPFIYFVWAGLLNEIVSTLAIIFFRNTAVNNNIYTVIEFSLVFWLFWSWNELGRKKMLYLGLYVAGLLIWMYNNLMFHSLNTISSYFWIYYAMAIVYLSVEQINQLLFTPARRINRNARFIICLSFLLFYTYQAVFEVFFVLTMKFSHNFYYNLNLIHIYINLLTNILFALAMLWLPTKRQFTLPY